MYYGGDFAYQLEISGGTGEYYVVDSFYEEFINDKWVTVCQDRFFVEGNDWACGFSIGKGATKAKAGIIVTDKGTHMAEWDSGECYICKIPFDFDMNEINLFPGQIAYMHYSGEGDYLPDITSNNNCVNAFLGEGSIDEGTFECLLVIKAVAVGTADALIRDEQFNPIKTIRVNVAAPAISNALELPENLQKIESEAFARINALYIRIPDSVMEIADDAIPKNMTLIVNNGSSIIEWALKNGYKVITE